jgi:hypothetical protein
MAITKMTADAINAHPSRRNRAKIEATTEDDIRRHMIEDGENPDDEVSERGHHFPLVYPEEIRNVPERVRQYTWCSGCDVAELGAEPGGDGASNDRVDAHSGKGTGSRASCASPPRRVVADRCESPGRIAARPRVWLTSPRRPPSAGPRDTARGARDCGKERCSARQSSSSHAGAR